MFFLATTPSSASKANPITKGPAAQCDGWVLALSLPASRTASSCVKSTSLGLLRPRDTGPRGRACYSYLKFAKLLDNFISGFVCSLNLSLQVLQVYLHLLLCSHSKRPLFPLILQLRLEFSNLKDSAGLHYTELWLLWPGGLSFCRGPCH